MASQHLEWRVLRGSRMTVPEHVVARELAQETVVLDVRSGKYHSLDVVGGRFFATLRESRDVEQARDLLVDEYRQPEERITTDLTGFCDVLNRLGLAEFEPS